FIRHQRADARKRQDGMARLERELAAVGEKDDLVGTFAQFPDDLDQKRVGLQSAVAADALSAQKELGCEEAGLRGRGGMDDARLPVQLAPRDDKVALAVLAKIGG